MAARAKRRRSRSGNKSRYNEIAAIILVAVSLLTLLCLVTSDPADPSLVTSSSQPVKNWVGFVGANIAAALFSAIGLIAYILPLLLLLVAFKCFQSDSLYIPFGRLLGFIIFILAGSGLTALFLADDSVVGVFTFQFSAYLLGTIGSGILMSALFLASVLLITNLSFVSFFESVQMGWGNFKFHFDEWFSKYKKWRDINVNAADEKAGLRAGASEERRIQQPPTISDGTAGGESEYPIIERLTAAANNLGKLNQGLDQSSSGIDPNRDIKISVKELKDLSNKDDGRTNGDFQPGSDIADIPVKPVSATGDLEKANGETESSAEKKSETTVPSYDDYQMPSIEFLTVPAARIEHNESELQETASKLVESAEEFNVSGQVKNINLGPVVTTYEFKPDPGVKYARVTSLADDLCLALKAESIRIERIPGKAVVGMEIPNKNREVILLRDVIDSKEFKESDARLTIALGKLIDGRRRVADLAKMPHLLIAGATGAGKSVGVNSLIVSILYKSKPDEVKFIMVDPKRLELGVYADIPHLATPIITDPKRAAISLKWAVSEMERRYKDLAGWGVRNIDGYNKEAKRKNRLKQFDENGNPHRPLPYIVIIIDELADLMIVSGKEVEESITRLAQMARAVGIHLVLATQRPSVDVITGLIKANFPSRISFRVSSKIDSRTIIDANGAERLLGRGDMLFLPPGTSHLVRVHGTYVDEKEIHKIVSHIKSQGKPEYDESITKSEEEMDDFGDLPGRKDDLFGEALKTVVGAKRASTSLLQRHLRIGYGRAAAILDALVADGYIGEMDGSKRARPVTRKAYEAIQEMEEGREF